MVSKELVSKVLEHKALVPEVYPVSYSMIILQKYSYIHSETFELHGLILPVSEDHLSVLLCIGNVCMETSVLHELILCVSEGFLCQ